MQGSTARVLLLRPNDPSPSTWQVEERRATWPSWFCQYIGLHIPKLKQAASPQLICPCNQHIIDVHGDHIHTTPPRSIPPAGRTNTRPF